MQRNTALINISFWFSLWSSAHYSKQKRTVQKATAKKFRLINTYSIYWIASNFFYWKRLQKIQWMDLWRTFLKPYAHAGFERRDFILYSWQNCIKAIICICSLPQISLVSCGRLQFMGNFFWRILNWKKKQYVTICVRKEVGVSKHFIFPSFDYELYHHLSYQNRDHYNSCSFVYKKSASKIRKIFAKLREFEVLIVWHQFMFTDVV